MKVNVSRNRSQFPDGSNPNYLSIELPSELTDFLKAQTRLAEARTATLKELNESIPPKINQAWEWLKSAAGEESEGGLDELA